MVTEKRTSRPGVVRVELNRSLTGMGHEHHRAGEEITGNRPPDELSRRLLDGGLASAVHIHSNEVTVELTPWGTSEGICDVIAGLFRHYVEGVTPKKFD